MKLLGYQPVQDHSTSSYIISPETEIIRSIPQPAAQLSYVKFQNTISLRTKKLLCQAGQSFLYDISR